MTEREELQLRLMTYNIGGGQKNSGSVLSDIIEVIKENSPDILAVQEATEHQDADNVWHSTYSGIAQAGGFGENFYFGPTLSMEEHMHVRKALFVDGIFDDWKNWRTGNAIFSRWKFVRLGDVSRPGQPRNIPLYLTPLYQGNRDSDPRYALIARIDKAPIFPFVVAVHFTTLVGERGPREIPGKAEEARLLRVEQARRVLDLLRRHVLERGEVVFLLGDFNAVANEPCISSVLETEGGFVRLVPSNAKIPTHPKAMEPIDHIFIYPYSRLIEYQCWTVDSVTARLASDHLPVVADVKIS